jgi:hypothetical protein
MKKLSKKEVKSCVGGPTTPHDHIGSFNFKVEIEG